MRIGVISDTHSRYQTVEKALAHLARAGVELVLHCGDIEDTKAVEMFREITAHFVYGNCDWDRAGLRRQIEDIGAGLHEPFGALELGKRKIAWIHGDDKRLFHKLEQSGQYDFLFYGHSHVPERHVTGRTVVVNPGALHRAKRKTFAILDLRSGEIESVVVD